MKNKILLGVLILSTISALIFIYFTNDHKECFNIQETLQTDIGQKVEIERHICKEIYNL